MLALQAFLCFPASHETGDVLDSLICYRIMRRMSLYGPTVEAELAQCTQDVVQ